MLKMEIRSFIIYFCRQGESMVNVSFPLEGLSFAFADYFCFNSGHENVRKGHCGLAPHHSSMSLEVVPPIN